MCVSSSLPPPAFGYFEIYVLKVIYFSGNRMSENTTLYTLPAVLAPIFLREWITFPIAISVLLSCARTKDLMEPQSHKGGT